MTTHAMSDLLLTLQDPERVAAVRRLLVLDTEPEEAFDRLTRLAAHLLSVPVTAVCLIDRDRQFIKSGHGLPEPWASRREMALDYSVCKHVIATRAPVVISDTRTDSRTNADRALANTGILAYAGVPLIAAGHAVGTLCALHIQTHPWSDDDVRLLNEIAAIVLDEITLRWMERSHHARRQWQGVGSHYADRSFW